ncbi:hypothetical protein BDN70DRAFT_936897 [Pholiota conissans]|uniref:Uncharacterized protein n=1 Tax=Pholiota conissans TaxID=109636 RepID=A0A9P5YUH5_9AGAR|nr:hypothetical protein BDN70DRAFT_936897 [Pholiota conissans]
MRPSDNEDNGNNISAQSLPQFQPTTPSTGDTFSGGRRLAQNADVIADILTATRESPSWKACRIEGTSWAGTAEENIEKYQMRDSWKLNTSKLLGSEEGEEADDKEEAESMEMKTQKSITTTHDIEHRRPE